MNDRPRGLDALIPTSEPAPLEPADVLTVGLRSLVLLARASDPASGDELVRDTLNQVIYDLDHPPKLDPLTTCRCGHLLLRHGRDDGACFAADCGCTAPMPA